MIRRQSLSRVQPQLEWLEPRVLYSADVATPFMPDDGAGHADVRLFEEPVDTTAATGAATDIARGHPWPTAVGAQPEAPETTAEGMFRQVAFIDAALVDSDVLAMAAVNSGIEVVHLAADRSGLEQIAQWLEARGSIDAIHLLAHGTSGALQLGSDWLDLSEAHATHDALLFDIGGYLTPDGDLLIYGCEFAAGDGGQAALVRLAQLTRADLAASLDPTGHAAMGGNWVLESQVGTLDVRALDISHWQGTLAGPVLDLDADDSSGVTGGDVQRTWTAGAGPAAIVDPDATLVDIDSANVELSVRFLFRPGGVHDTLSTELGGASFDAVTGELTWSGTPADAVQVLRSLRFDNVQPDTSMAVRVVEVTVSDGVDTATQRAFLLARPQAETLLASFDPALDRLETTGYELSLGVSRGASLPSIPPGTLGEEPSIVRLGVVLASTRIGPFLPGDTVTLSLRATWNGPALASASLPASALGPAKAWFELDVGTLPPETLNALVDPVLRVDTNVVGGGVALGMDPAAVSIGQGSYLPDGQFTASPLAAFRWFIRDAETNEAPTLIAGHTHPLAPTDEDTASSGTAVTALLASAGWADADPGALSGIAVTAATGRGTWQYSTDGATWTAFGSVSTGNALLLTGSTQVRYLPDAVAGETAGFTYRAWDQTAGSASTPAAPAYASTAITGGSSAFSINSALAQIVVADVNDAPVLDTTVSPTLGSVLEGATNPAGVSVATLLVDGSITDPDGAAVEALAITGVNPALGAWQYSLDAGATWLTIDAPQINSQTNELALLLGPSAQLRLVPFGDLNGSLADAITFRAWDQSSGTSGQYAVIAATGGSTAFSAASDTAAITVTPVNDAPTFRADDGIVTTALGPSLDQGFSTIVQPDGRILMAGQTTLGSIGTFAEFALVRYLADGSLDPTFGTGGIVKTDIGPRHDQGLALALQADGRIVLGGVATAAGGRRDDFALARYNTNGTLDTSFGNDGIVTTALGTTSTVGLSIGVQPDGKIVLAGYAANPPIPANFALARFNTDGTLDAGFGTGGTLTTDFIGAHDGAFSMAIQPDGRIVAAGYAELGPGDYEFGLVRYNGDGSLDTAFGVGGRVTSSFVGNAVAYSVALQPDGRILIGGSAMVGGSDDFALMRFNSDGSADASFGTAGTVTTRATAGIDTVRSIGIQRDGKIVVGGTAGEDFALARYFADGFLDFTFGDGGIVTTPINLYEDTGYSLSLQPDGRIVLGGYARDTSGGLPDFAIARYNPDGSLDTTFGGASTSTVGGTVAYTEGGSPVVLAPAAAIFDAELSAAGSFAGATLTLARNGGASAQDLYSATGTLGALNPGGALVVDGTPVGTVTTNGDGTLLLTFDAAATEARVNAVMRQIAYANASDAPPASVLIDWTFSDGNSAAAQGTGGARSATGSVTVAITAVNDAPTAGAPAGFTITEDTAGNLTYTGTPFADADSTNLTVTLSIADGVLAASTGGGVTVAGTATARTFAGTTAALNAFFTTAGNITYTPASDNTDARILTTEVSDGAASATASSTITITPVNDAPVLEATVSPALGSVLEGATNPAGVSVATLLVDGSITDPDGAAVEALAITGVNPALGAWQYSLDAGATWLTIDAPQINSQTNELALLLGPSAQLRLVPFGDLNGSLADAITFRAWDQSSGTSGQYVVIAATGGSTAFSAASDTASITVTPVNDAPTFRSGDGIVITDVALGVDQAWSLAPLPDGKVLVAGSAELDVSHVLLARLLPDGSLDMTFGSNGLVVTRFGDGPASARDIHVLPDGRIVVAGTARVADVDVFAVARYLGDGTLDASFGTEGRVTTSLGRPAHEGHSIAVQSDGSVILAGTVGTHTPDARFAMLRYTAAGVLDTGFGTDGAVVTGFDGVAGEGSTVALQADGRILIGGSVRIGLDRDYALERYLPDGTPDLAFGASGRILYDLGSNSDIALTLHLQGDGRIVLAGYSVRAGSIDFALLRVDADGSRDSTFGTNGVVVTALGAGPDVVRAVASQPDGALVVAGFSTDDMQRATIARYTAGGVLDASFGEEGKVISDWGPGSAAAHAITITSDGRIVVAGFGVGATGRDFALARYKPDGSLDTTFDVVDTVAGTIAYTEGGSPVVLAPAATVFDAELSAAGSFAGATLTLARNGGASAQDLYSATGTLGGLNPGGALVVDGTPVGTVTTNGDGTLLLTFDAAATEARVNAVMRQIAYANASDAPPASVLIDWTFSDGNSAAAQGSGGVLAAFASVTVAITATNDPPMQLMGIPDQVATEDVPFSFTVPADTFADADAGDVLLWSATRADGSDLPGWLTFDPVSRTFSGTPTNADVGVVALRVTVTDTAQATAAASFSLSVENVNDAPLGQPRIVGTLAIGETLRADLGDISDEDGLGDLATNPRFQWLRGDEPVAGATDVVYVIGDADVGQVLAVRVGWTDGRGTPESLTSPPAGPVPGSGAPDDQPPGGAPGLPGSPPGGPGPGAMTPQPGQPSSDDPARSDGSSGAGSSPTPESGQSAGTGRDGAVRSRGDAPGSASVPPAGSAGPDARMPANAIELHYEPERAPGRVQAGPLSPGAPLSPLLLEGSPERVDVAAFLRRLADPSMAQQSEPASLPNRPAFVWSPMLRPQAAEPDAPGVLDAGAASPAQIAGLVASAAVLVWAARSAGLTVALLASVPLWRNLDPLHVLPNGSAAAGAAEAGDESDLPAPRTVVRVSGGRLIASMDAYE
jgi:uncharacterized delta-60 repeat protein